MANNHTKFKDLPKGNQIFLYSYFALLLLTLGGFVTAAVNSPIGELICTILLIITLITNVIVAFLK
ncbi:hypothetical protein [Acetilactobacillus jinshanensis]|uniref:Uncharacterized protein n=1 Tax=Acetilactobacillus jinshanensis TaxID=1720083 RepID=A0A4P6ZLT5_9LACO|nr:hypothetical protein [Acetilactobacillus jinshanensis]QBP18362.1 hypothetical protein ELX58_04250 [Acetilactobacillus jinshanensis]URL61227.1 hypothetical protein HGK75_04320 [uncultured bacterium]